MFLKKTLFVSHVSVKDDIRKEALSELPITLGKLVKDTSATTVPAISNQLKRSSVNTDRQLEIRVQGIPESSDTSQLMRMEFDERHVSDVPKNVDEQDHCSILSICANSPEWHSRTFGQTPRTTLKALKLQ